MTMTDRDIDQLTAAFAYAITALDAQAVDKDTALALINKAHQCWDELLTEIVRLQAHVRLLTDGRIPEGVRESVQQMLDTLAPGVTVVPDHDPLDTITALARQRVEVAALREIVQIFATRDETQMTLGEYRRLKEQARALLAGKGGTQP